MCEGLEKVDRGTAIKKLIKDGFSKDIAIKLYNTWRYNYVRTYGGGEK